MYLGLKIVLICVDFIYITLSATLVQDPTRSIVLVGFHGSENVIK